MHWLMVLLERSLDLSVSGWYVDESLSLTPVSLCKARQNLDMKSLSRSEMISFGKPFSQYQWSKNNKARSSVEIFIFVGMIHMSECSQSMIDKIQPKPSSKGSGPIKSKVTLSARLSGIGKGCRGLGTLVIWDLFLWQLTHEGM